MNFAAIQHEPKSNLSYPVSTDTLHIRLKTAKDDIDRVKVRAVDPFNYIQREDNPDIYEFETKSIVEFKMEKEYTTDLHDCWFAEVKGFTWSRIRYGFHIISRGKEYLAGCHSIVDLDERPSEVNNTWNYYNFPYINEEDIFAAPEWVKDTVWYQIFPERFYNGLENSKEEQRNGGNLEGVIEKLDYIREMGFTGIYFTPIFEAPSAHKYDTTDYFKIDPLFGTNETFKRLIEEAHKREIKIMLDAVFNHCGYYHPFWQDVLKNGKASKYYNCFYILDENKPIITNPNPDGTPGSVSRHNLNYRAFGYTPFMPKWNTGHPLVRKYLLEAALYWAKDYGIDGWRADVSNEVSHDFWREFRRCVKKANPDLYIIGENWDNSAAWLGGDQFDAVMNYEFLTCVWNFFGKSSDRREEFNAVDFKNHINKLLTLYPKTVAENMFNLLDSHDTARIMTVCNEQIEIVKLAYVFLMVYGGTPSIYYGSEVGMGGSEQNSRQPMIWQEENQNLDLKNHIRRLIELRKSYDSFKSVDIRWLYADNETNTVILRKTGTNQLLYVILHNHREQVEISVPEELCNKKLFDVYGETECRLQKKLVLYPYEYHLLMDKSCE